MNPIIQAFLQAREQASRDFYAQKRMEQEKMEAETMSEWRKQQAANQAEQIKAQAERYKAEADFKKKQLEAQQAAARLGVVEKLQNASAAGKLPMTTKTLEPFLDYIPQNEDYFSNEVYGKPNPLVQQTGLDRESLARSLATLGGDAFNPEQALQALELVAGPEDVNRQKAISAMAAATPQFALQKNAQEFTKEQTKSTQKFQSAEKEKDRTFREADEFQKHVNRLALEDKRIGAKLAIAAANRANQMAIVREKAALKQKVAGDLKIKLTTTQQDQVNTLTEYKLLAERAKELGDRLGWKDISGPILGPLRNIGKATGMISQDGADFIDTLNEMKSIMGLARGGKSFTETERKMLLDFVPQYGIPEETIKSRLGRATEYSTRHIDRLYKIAAGERVDKSAETKSNVGKKFDPNNY